MRLALAFLSAITLPSVLATAWFLHDQLYYSSDNPSVYHILRHTIDFLWFAFFISGGFVLLLGLPMYFLLRYFKAVRWWSILAAGFILGATPITIVSLYSDPIVDWLLVGIVSVFGAYGLIAALAFWLVAPKQGV